MPGTEPELSASTQTLTGYAHPKYCLSLADVGSAHLLTRSGGSILQRAIPDTPYCDAMGSYPLFSCDNWSHLKGDIEDLSPALVSLTLVTDPFGEYNEDYLRDSFKDKVVRFKEHFVTDLHQRMETFVDSHHQRYARKALQAVQIQRCTEPMKVLDDWTNLYANLVKRHNIRGLTTFSRVVFAAQFEVPGLVIFEAQHEGRIVGMLLWYLQKDVAYYHLGAYSDKGYELRSSFALFWTAMKYFSAAGVRWVNLGAGAGVTNEGSDGLSRFKRGWSTGTRSSYLCGCVLNEEIYTELTRRRGVAESEYFPAYRSGEFA
jgi:GNAT acetyltransferase-like protein